MSGQASDMPLSTEQVSKIPISTRTVSNMPLTIQQQIGACLVALVAGPILMILGACISLEAGYCQATWKTAPAKVKASSSTRSRSYSSGKQRLHHNYNFVYQYNLNGERHRGSSIDHGMISKFFDFNTAWAVDNYPVGSDVTIHYNPKSPHHSVLVNTIPWEGPIEIFLGFGLFLGGYVGLQKLK